MTSRQAGAAVPHLIEAGETRAALAAALRAHHYKKAMQIVQVTIMCVTVCELYEEDFVLHIFGVTSWYLHCIFRLLKTRNPSRNNASS